jgi:hypothetical protein
VYQIYCSFSAYTYAAVKTAVRENFGIPLKDLIPIWTSKLPPGLETSFGKGVWTPVMVETVVTSFARAAEMAEEGCFRGARQLLKSGRTDWHSYPPDKLEKKFDRNFRWQNMYIDLMECQQQLLGSICTEISRQKQIDERKSA